MSRKGWYRADKRRANGIRNLEAENRWLEERVAELESNRSTRRRDGKLLSWSFITALVLFSAKVILEEHMTLFDFIDKHPALTVILLLIAGHYLLQAVNGLRRCSCGQDD